MTQSSPEGHTFRFRFDIRGSSKVVGDPEHTDAPDFMGPTHEFQVRAWSLRQALLTAAELPFDGLMSTEAPDFKVSWVEGWQAAMDWLAEHKGADGIALAEEMRTRLPH